MQTIIPVTFPCVFIDGLTFNVIGRKAGELLADESRFIKPNVFVLLLEVDGELVVNWLIPDVTIVDGGGIKCILETIIDEIWFLDVSVSVFFRLRSFFWDIIVVLLLPVSFNIVSKVLLPNFLSIDDKLPFGDLDVAE